MPLPWSRNVRPAGTVPLVTLSAGRGWPVPVTSANPAVPMTKNAVPPNTSIEGAWAVTTSAKSCVAAGLTPLSAVMTRSYVPALLPLGEPASVPLLKLTPLGRFPLSMIVGAGNPVAVKLNVSPCSTGNVYVELFVMAGALVDAVFRMNVCAAVPPGLPASIVNV